MRFDSKLFTISALLAGFGALGCVDVTCAERGTCPPGSSPDDTATIDETTRSTDSQGGTTASTDGSTQLSSMSGADASPTSDAASPDSTASDAATSPSTASSDGCDAAGCMCTSGDCVDAGQPCDAQQNAACEASGNVCWLNDDVGTCVECVFDADCSEFSPACVAHACEVCDLATHRGCSEAAPFCVTADEPQTLGDAAAAWQTAGGDSAPLTDLDAASLDAGSNAVRSCVACRNSTDCGGAAPICLGGACIECETNSDCTDPTASQCDIATHSCTPCDAVGECSHLAGTPACNVEAGTCVECTAAERAACDDKACTTVPGETQFTCSEQDLGDAFTCEPCVSDAACEAGRKCLLETFDGEATEWVCLPKQGDGTGEIADCSSSPPTAALLLDSTSVDQDTGTFCKPRRTTCAATRTYGVGGLGGNWCQSDDDCGLVGVADGLCLPYNNNADTKLCTYPCQLGFDCAADLECAFVSGSGDTRVCTLD